MKSQQKIYEKVNCNLCGSKNQRVIIKARHENEKDFDLVDKFRASGDELLIDQLVQCNLCGLKFINPRIKGETIVSSYSEGEDPLFVSQAESRERTFFNSLKKIKKYLPKGGKILDVGTAGGSFLVSAKRFGFEPYGCEPNKWLAKWGKEKYGLDIRPGTIFDQKYKQDFFDVVSLWDVIEHTPDPLKVLIECNRVLKNDGVLIVNYPDIGSWIAKLTGKKWLFLTSVHLYYFTRNTINLMLKKAGFEIIKIKPHFQELEAGYIFFRGKSYNNLIGSVGESIVKILGMGNRPVPYWLGQTLVIARKKKR